MFTFTSESGARELFELVDIEAIHTARDFMLAEIATQLSELFVDTYLRHQELKAYQPDIGDIAKRKLKNIALAFIARVDKNLANDYVLAQIESCNNMTDHLGALAAANSR